MIEENRLLFLAFWTFERGEEKRICPAELSTIDRSSFNFTYYAYHLDILSRFLSLSLRRRFTHHLPRLHYYHSDANKQILIISHFLLYSRCETVPLDLIQAVQELSEKRAEVVAVVVVVVATTTAKNRGKTLINQFLSPSEVRQLWLWNSVLLTDNYWRTKIMEKVLELLL